MLLCEYALTVVSAVLLLFGLQETGKAISEVFSRQEERSAAFTKQLHEDVQQLHPMLTEVQDKIPVRRSYRLHKRIKSGKSKSPLLRRS